MDFSEVNVVCRLCLKKLTENCEPIGEIVQHTLNFLTIFPNLSISDDPMMCECCALNLKKCFDFKARCLSTEDRVASFAEGENKKVDLRDIYSEVKKDRNIERARYDHSVCRFCLQSVKDNASTSVRRNDDLIKILQNYFPEMDLRLTDDIIACTPCYNCLRCHVSFVNNYLSIEEKINEYCKVEGVNYKGQVDLRDVAKFISKSTMNVENISSLMIQDEHENITDVKDGIDIKFEEFTDVKQENKELVNKEIQQNNSNSLQHRHPPSQSVCIPQQAGTKSAKNTCELSGYQNDRKEYRQELILAQEHDHKYTLVLTKVYKCNLCPYMSKWKANLNAHALTHKDFFEVTKYKCELCAYESTHKIRLKRHMLIHTPSDVKPYKCDVCGYKANWKHYITRHMLKHKTPSEITMYKCEMCDYSTKRKCTLTRHIANHKTISETARYKCEVCAYRSGRKYNLEKHKLIHKDGPEIEMHKI